MFGRGRAIKEKAELTSKQVMPVILEAIKNCNAKGARFEEYEVESPERKTPKKAPCWEFFVFYQIVGGFKYKEILEAELLAATRKYQSQNKIPDSVTDMKVSVLGDKGIKISYTVLD